MQNTSVGCQETKAGAISEAVTAQPSAKGGAVPGVGAPGSVRNDRRQARVSRFFDGPQRPLLLSLR